MANKTLEASSEPRPKCRGYEYLEDCTWSCSVMIDYSYQGALFSVLASSNPNDLPQDYDLDQSIEGKIITEIHDLSYDPPTEEKDEKKTKLHDKLAELASDVCFPLMRGIAPKSPLPKPRTLEEELYPPSYVLQITTEDDKLIARKIDYERPVRFPPLSDQRLQEIAPDLEVPVFDLSEVILIARVHSLVWKVEVDGEMMICKVSMHPIFGTTLANELGVYHKIRRLGDELKFPKLKGIVRYHTGIIAMLLSYIPHKHSNLRWILQYVKDGSLPKTEASAAMRTKWGEQIKNSVMRLHEIGVLWRDVKTDNVLIDDEGDAIVLDFGGGNTVGWVDEDKYGTLEGDIQGLDKILAALREE
ncbi:putative protein kinase-like [Rosellinia necatrix]|uniref:Protein kinase domain-containing protein n=1 Tax=Rosellinia necatrix TaxID=77044 RepID=A0A1W2TNU7_ROSNE|nr:putative protein kinase-like [Rosellinia necatrix]